MTEHDSWFDHAGLYDSVVHVPLIFWAPGLVPSARGLDPDAPRTLARAFARIQWPAYGVLLATGIWNVSAVGSHQPHAWQAVLGVKITAEAAR